MSRNSVLCWLAAAMLAGLAAVAQDDEAPDESAERETAPGAAEEAAETPQSDDIFIPSEEVQAAEELAFPVNI